MRGNHEEGGVGVSGGDPRREILRTIRRNWVVVFLCFAATTAWGVWRTYVFPRTGEGRLRGGAIVEFSLPLSVEAGSEAARSAACYVEVHARDRERAEAIGSVGFVAFMRGRPDGLRAEPPPVKLFPVGGEVNWSLPLVMSLLGLFLGVLVASAIEDRRKRRRLKAAAAGSQLPAEGGEAATLSPDVRVLFAALGPFRHVIWATVFFTVGGIHLYGRHLEARDIERGRNWTAAVELSFPASPGESEQPEARALIEVLAGSPEDAREVVKELAAAYLSVAEPAPEPRTSPDETVERRERFGWVEMLVAALFGLIVGIGFASAANSAQFILRQQRARREAQAHTPSGPRE
ncbi:MAG: hypothetical protein HYY13_13220 [Nitrospirae bacterium]|nr:hypothetical protein [Nitrospirota bacterium]